MKLYHEDITLDIRDHMTAATENEMNNRIILCSPIEDSDCAICQTSINSKYCKRFYKCKHEFHIKCINQWISMDASCPMCRHRIVT